MKQLRIIGLVTVAALAIPIQFRVPGLPIVFTFQGVCTGFVGATTFSNTEFAYDEH